MNQKGAEKSLRCLKDTCREFLLVLLPPSQGSLEYHTHRPRMPQTTQVSPTPRECV